jgi:hypothetical protein
MRYLLMTLCCIVFLIQNLCAHERPNLVMIFTDDQRCDAVGYAGNDAVHTPHLDRLANRVACLPKLFRQYLDLRDQPSQALVRTVSRPPRW